MEFRGDIKLASFGDWSLGKLKDLSKSNGHVNCPNCDGLGEILVDIELPSGRWMEVDDECPDCEGSGIIDSNEIEPSECLKFFDIAQYRADCSETIRLLSLATNSDFFLNICKAKEMHFGRR